LIALGVVRTGGVTGAGDIRALRDHRSRLHGLALAADAIAVAIDGTNWVAPKLEALRAHATQVNTQMFAMSDELGEAVWSHEYYRLAAGTPYPAGGWADDLFAGLV
jgi:LmbE family N-acetylglucosaminyl deacetylase